MRWLSRRSTAAVGAVASLAFLVAIMGCDHRSIRVAGDPPPAPVAKELALGFTHSCALGTDGKARCWGDDEHGESSPPEERLTQISALYRHTCGLREDGRAVCWGRDTWGEAGEPTERFRQISAGMSHTCALRTDGTLRCWGFDGWGEGESHAGTFKQVVAGSHHTCALRDDDSVACWGRFAGTGTVRDCWDDEEGGGFECKEIDTELPAGPFVALSAGHLITCGLRPDGSSECWGERAEYCGLYRSGVTQICAGSGYTCALDQEGEAACKVCGFGPQLPSGPFQRLAVGWGHACAIGGDGSVACWGQDDLGQATPPSGSDAGAP